ncbi:hypothetical protein HJB99_12490 [Rhizobium sp. NLR17b]|uniref:hypothetical protein n=1 Tax=Rhizobium sp. NLR17b TaxID=2731114 RepID=UPI001C82AFC0|nr:hypothetical protein [Rhizobium sp. NLR17b]MBX5269490.1 hypothetical protein [Rhizobium sp. NLR17b]
MRHRLQQLSPCRNEKAASRTAGIAIGAPLKRVGTQDKPKPALICHNKYFCAAYLQQRLWIDRCIVVNYMNFF